MQSLRQVVHLGLTRKIEVRRPVAIKLELIDAVLRRGHRILFDNDFAREYVTRQGGRLLRNFRRGVQAKRRDRAFKTAGSAAAPFCCARSHGGKYMRVTIKKNDH
jgi:hypothetical protein